MATGPSKPRKPGGRARTLTDVLAEALARSRRDALAASPEEAWRELDALRSLGTPPTVH